METMLYNLKAELEYSNKGDYEKTATIEISAPSYDCLREASRLSQYVMRAIMDSAKYKGFAEGGEVSDDAATIDAGAVKVILLASSIDFPEFIDAFKSLLIKSGFVAESVKFKEAYFKKLEYDDIITMACEYCANFIFPSLF